MKSTRNIEIEIHWGDAQEAMLLEGAINSVINTIREVSTLPVQHMMTAEERLRIKHMDAALEYEKLKLQVEEKRLELARFKEEQKKLLLTGPKQESDDQQNRQQVNGNGAVKNGRRTHSEN